MALNRKTFQTRALTAIIFAAVMLVGLLWNQWSFLVLFSIIHFGCWWEYFKLAEKIHQTTFHVYTRLGFMLLGYGLMLWFCNRTYSINGYGIKDNISLPLSIAGFVMLVIGIFQKNPIRLKAFGMVLLGLLYISLSMGLMIFLRNYFPISEISIDYQAAPSWHSLTVPCAVIASIWINDTMAYIVGSFMGKTPLSKISPKKTWEGTTGGVILALIVTGLLAYKFDFDVKVILVIAGISAIAGTFGDLLESKLKRMAGVKDSGSFMPGHGGFLDRFDSLLIAVPCVWIYLWGIPWLQSL